MGIHRSHQRRMKRQDAARTKTKNKIWKDKERARRDARMMDTLRTDDPPYGPAVTSWLCRKLEKKASGITSEDVKILLA